MNLIKNICKTNEKLMIKPLNYSLGRELSVDEVENVSGSGTPTNIMSGGSGPISGGGTAHGYNLDADFIIGH